VFTLRSQNRHGSSGELPGKGSSSTTSHGVEPMPIQRELVFRCVFSSPSSERVGRVRAWDAAEAVQLFETELRTEGVDERGTIHVFGAEDREKEQGAYDP